MQRLSWRSRGLAALLSLTLVALFSFSMMQPNTVSAQFEEPTATPADPIWLGFVAARSAIEEKEGVDLTIVQRWDWWQDDWSAADPRHPQGATGLDGCDSSVNIGAARPIYFGWTYQITSLRNIKYEARVTFDLQSVVVCDEPEDFAAPAPSGGEAANPDLPGAVVGAGATGNFELGGHVAGLDQAAIDAMRASGMTWVKKQLPVSAGVQKGYEFINDAHANGFKILLGVVGDKNALATDFDNYINTDYVTFVRALAEAGADAIEIWNEPNIDREWPGNLISGANYTKMLAASYNAIKSVNPNTIVISGAPAPTGFFGAAGCGDTGCNDDVFMQQMAQAGAAQYIDCVGLHYNEGIVPPTQQSGDPRGEYPTYYFQSMTNRGVASFPGKKVCYTELGYLSKEGISDTIPAGFAWANDVTLQQQTQWLAGAAAAAAQRGDVLIMIVWNINFTSTVGSDPMDMYRITNRIGGCPACTALGQVMGG